MMDQKEFNYYVEQHIKDFLPEEEQDSSFVYVHPVRKTNDIIRQGLSIRREDEKVSPVIYLENAWEAYQGGENLNDVLKKIAEVYQEHKSITNLELSMNYDEVKDRSVSVVVGKEANKNNLKSRVYTDLGCGLVETYVIQQAFSHMDENGRIIITHDLMRKYGYDLEQVRQEARENTPKLAPAKMQTLFQVMIGDERDQLQNPKLNTEEFYVLSNTEKFQGAGVLFYPEMQKMLAERFGKNYYVLPSSLHEVIIVPERKELNPAGLENMVKDVNTTAVDKEDFLSDKILYYDKERGQLQMAMPNEPQRSIGQKELREAR